jgi:hypothetical protein
MGVVQRPLGRRVSDYFLHFNRIEPTSFSFIALAYVTKALLLPASNDINSVPPIVIDAIGAIGSDPWRIDLTACPYGQ